MTALPLNRISFWLAAISLDLAEVFGKRHDNVLRDIEAIFGRPSELRHEANQEVKTWFKEVKSPHPTVPGRLDRAFDLTRDGFTLLAMGWTGAKAMAFKIQYIEAFNRMEQLLRQQAAPAPALNDPHALRAMLLGSDGAGRHAPTAEFAAKNSIFPIHNDKLAS